MLRISWQAEEILSSQERLWFLKLVGWLVIFHFNLCLLFCTFGITLNFVSQNQRLLIMIPLHWKYNEFIEICSYFVVQTYQLRYVYGNLKTVLTEHIFVNRWDHNLPHHCGNSIVTTYIYYLRVIDTAWAHSGLLLLFPSYPLPRK